MKFIIIAPGYDDNAGGIVVLHQLCDRLNLLGHESYLWPFFKPALNCTNPFKTIYLFIKYFRKQIKYGFKKNYRLNTPTANYADLEGAVIVYPEVVVGNPLRAKNVVRWLLHKPGFNNGGKINFGTNDLFFYYDKAFDDSRYNKYSNNHLHIISQRSDVYKITNPDTREGTCYLLRKGYKREIEHNITNSILIDKLSHKDTAKVFNQVQYCISYDTYTMYHIYAVMCGCIPIVIPEKGITKEQWQPNEENRYGIAYGFNDVEYAVQTRPLLLLYMEKQERESNESVIRFVEKCQTYFDL